MLLPLPLLISVLLGFLSLGILGGGMYCVYRVVRELKQPRYVVAPMPTAALRSRSHLEVGERPEPLRDRLRQPSVLVPLSLSLLLLLFTFGGGHILAFAYQSGPDGPNGTRNGTVQTVQGTSGAQLRVETYGPADGPALLFTHGWGMDSTEWYYVKRDLSDRFRLIVWDLPGLGESSQPDDRNYALEAMAQDLHSVLRVANGRPVILVGHSIGGMINLTFCRLYPETLGHEVSGIVQLDTSYTNPVKTADNSKLNEALQKPVAEPILHAMIWLSPLVHLMNWISYENGTSFLNNAHSGFAGAETREQVERVSLLQTKASPAVLARGMLAMFHWDATSVLPNVHVPVLLVVGDQDTTTLPSASQLMQKTMPEAQLVVVSPSKHYSLLELNKEVDARIREFASSLRGATAAN